MNETQLRELILKAISEAVGDTAGAQPAAPVPPASGAVESGEVRDLSAVDFRQIIDVPTPANPEEFRRMRSKTVARIGVWRSGPRCRTNTYLRFRADHAAAMDAVFTDVPERLLEEMGLFTVQTLCETKDMYLTRPDLGRRFSQETLAELQQRCKRNPDVQLVVQHLSVRQPPGHPARHPSRAEQHGGQRGHPLLHQVRPCGSHGCRHRGLGLQGHRDPPGRAPRPGYRRVHERLHDLRRLCGHP